ncbi:MAG: peptidoglycan-binding protein LysM [Gemmatimonadota bacterium]|nr:peptidoglycan-binding protein LysM [Gemmatimonadota bacterium]
MGLFDFIKGAGRKEEAKKDEERNELIKGNKLLRYVMSLGLDVEGLKVKYDDGVATVTGKAKSQADREKVVLALGNTDGVAQVDDQMEVASPEAEAKFYTVQKGDSLSKIAKEAYGDAMKYPVIFEANKPMLTDPNLIYPGQVLRIPPAS